MSDELKLKIILDDGSVKQGFLSIEKQGDQTAAKIGKSFDDKNGGINSLSESADGFKSSLVSLFNPLAILAASTAAAAKVAFDFALAGEQVNAVNAQFTNLANSAGIAADAFADAIIRSTQGLIDDEDALQIATKGIVSLGTEAQRLPQVLDLARNASRALGKDFKDSFESLSSFVETGNKKVLRQFGIVLDLDEAYKKAAKSVGLTTDQLTEQQQQTIRLNLLLGDTAKKFDVSAKSVTPLKDEFDKLKVSLGNYIEGLQVAFGNKFGGLIASAISQVSSLFTKLTEIDSALSLEKSSSKLASFNTTILEAKIKVPELQSKLANLNSELEKTQSVGEKVQINSQIQKITGQIDGLTSRAAVANEAIQKLGGAQVSENTGAVSQDPAAAASTTTLDLTPAQKKLKADAEAKRLFELNQFTLAQNKIVLDGEVKNLENIKDVDVKISQIKVLSEQQSIFNEQDKNTKLSQIEEQFSNKKDFTLAQREQARAAVIDSFNALEVERERKKQEDLKLLVEQSAIAQMGTFELLKYSATSTIDEVIKKFEDYAINVGKNFQDVRKAATDTIGNGVTRAFGDFGKALGRGEAAGQAFVDAIGDTIAQVAAQFGNFFIQTGIGKIALSYGTDGTGYAMLAAGIALNALAGSFSKKSSSGSASSDTGGGIASSPSTTTELTPNQNLQRQEAGTSVQVTIQGDVLDSDESGSRIVDLINQAFDKKGVTVQAGAYA